jgi:dihydrofolate reductase
MSITIIYACNTEGIIGLNGDIPWRVPEDFKHFRQATIHKPVVMGSKTWDSLPVAVRPLKDRENWVLTNDPSARVFTGANVGTVEQVLELSKLQEVFVIGGSSLIMSFYPHARKVILTEVDAVVIPGAEDTVVYADIVPEYFSLVNCSRWKISTSGISYRFKTYMRK